MPAKTSKIGFRRWIAAAVSGLLLTASFPNLDLAWAAWFALVPWLAAVEGLSWKQGAKVGFAAGLVHYLSLIYWVAYTMRTYGYLPWAVCIAILLLFAGVLSLYPALFGGLIAGLPVRPATALVFYPALWVTLEFGRATMLTGFPWAFLGHSQYRALHIIQISDIFGVYGISALLVAVNTALVLVYRALRERGRSRPAVSPKVAAAAVIVAAGLTAATWMYGTVRTDEVEGWSRAADTMTTAVVQGNIPQAVKWDPLFQRSTVHKYLQLSRGTLAENPELIVWPETALPFYFRRDAQLTAEVVAGVRDLGVYVLLGSPAYESGPEGRRYYNSAYLIAPDGGVRGRYDKVHLVPFGEYVPLKRWLPFLGTLVAQVGDFTGGKIGDTLLMKQTSLGVLICYESIFPYISRAAAANGAELLVNITNDAWYGRSSAPYQHFSLAVFRAVENRRALVRAANTGISGFIDPVGRIHNATALFEDDAVVRPVPLLRQTTAYTRHGDRFAKACVLAAGLFTFVQIMRIFIASIRGGKTL